MFLPEPRKRTDLQATFYLNKYYEFEVPQDLTDEKKYLLDFLDKYGITRGDSKGKIKFIQSDAIRHGAYRLICQDHEVIIQSSSKVGFFYGINAFIQIVNDMKFRGREHITSFKIDDSPRFKWRSIMLDCSSYFIEIEHLKKIIEVMSVYKLNILHLKLTGNSSWRLESRRYRNLNKANEQQYKVEEMKELIAFADKHHVQVLPELTLPTHMDKLIEVYPELSCRTQSDNSKHICLTDETVKKKMKALIKEVVSLFPFEYIHLGAYDLGLAEFIPCPKCLERLKELDTEDRFELVSEFMNEIVSFINLCGKKVIYMNDVGHDLHDGDQIIQYRKDIYYVGDEYKLINDGVKIINSNCDYYDFSQSFLDVTLKQLYNFEPMVKKIDKKHNKYLEGIEGILWTDHVESSYQLYEYLFPRLFAFSEVAWTSKENRNYQSFENRVYSHLNLLEKMGVKHYTPINKCNYGFIRRKANKAFKK